MALTFLERLRLGWGYEEPPIIENSVSSDMFNIAIGGNNNTDAPLGVEIINPTTAFLSIVQICSSLRAKEVSKTKFKIQLKSDESEVTDGWLNSLIDEPNQEDTFSDLLEKAMLNLDWSGNIYIYYELSKVDRMPYLMKVLQSDQVTVEYDTSGIVRFVHNFNGTTTTYLPNQILHIRNNTPRPSGSNPFIGTPLLLSIKEDIYANKELSAFINRFIHSDGLPPLVYYSQVQMDQKQKALFKSDWNSQNPRNKITANLGINDKLLPLPNSSIAADDSATLKTFDEIIWQRICSAFGVPKPMILGDSANFATAKTNLDWFKYFTINGLITIIFDNLNKWIKKFDKTIKFEPEYYKFNDGDALNKKRETMIRTLTYVQSTGITLSQQQILDLLELDIKVDTQPSLNLNQLLDKYQ